MLTLCCFTFVKSVHAGIISPLHHLVLELAEALAEVGSSLESAEEAAIIYGELAEAYTTAEVLEAINDLKTVAALFEDAEVMSALSMLGNLLTTSLTMENSILIGLLPPSTTGIGSTTSLNDTGYIDTDDYYGDGSDWGPNWGDPNQDDKPADKPKDSPDNEEEDTEGKDDGDEGDEGDDGDDGYGNLNSCVPEGPIVFDYLSEMNDAIENFTSSNWDSIANFLSNFVEEKGSMHFFVITTEGLSTGSIRNQSGIEHFMQENIICKPISRGVSIRLNTNGIRIH